MSSRLLRRLRADESGVTIVEVLAAAVVLVTGILAAFLALDGSRDLVTVSERTEIATHRGQQELERVRLIPYTSLELAAAPGTSTDPTDGRYHVGAGGTAYDWDHASTANAAEPLVVKAPAAVNPDAIVSRRTWSDGRYSGALDTFVTIVSAGLKRVTVAVKVDGNRAPRKPIVLSTLVSEAAETAP